VTGPSAALVGGALLVLDATAAPATTSTGIVDSLLMAVHVSESAAPDAVVQSVLSTLGQLGWNVRSSSSTSTGVDAGQVPLAVAMSVVGDSASAVGTAVTALRQAPASAQHAFEAFRVSAPGARDALVVEATVGADGPALGLVHLSLAPATPATGFPWTELAGPGVLTAQRVELVANPVVYTDELRTQLAAKVAGAVAGGVIPLTH
jgi:hypothetical protein